MDKKDQKRKIKKRRPIKVVLTSKIKILIEAIQTMISGNKLSIFAK
jgi:hypothetical protein